MSKSLGNIFQLSEAIDQFGGEVVVAYLSSGHYRQPLEFSERAMEETRARLERIRNFAEVAESGAEDAFVAEKREEFLAALADDFNTPRAWAALFELIAEGNRRPLPGAREALAELLELLGLESLLARGETETDERAGELLAERERARAERDFERADALRDELAELGWEIRDTPEGAKLRRA
jgi:cysteinyl-tRNA synthetase